jgi:Transposase protein
VATVLREQEVNQPLVLPGLETPCEVPVEEPIAATPIVGSTPSRYAGATLLYAALSRLGLWAVLEKLQPEIGPARRAGWRQVVATLILCFALRFRSVEDLKNAEPRDLGALLGEATSPGVQSLRIKVRRLVESIDPLALSRALLSRYLALEPVWEGLYYVDGHFVPYYGGHPTPKGWNPKRRLAEPGHTDVYVHDARGRVLFFLSQPLNDSLARAVPSVVEEIRTAHGGQPFTLVFDRGGYSGKLFRWLEKEGIGYITYLKGRKARRRYPLANFSRGWFAFDGKRTVYRLFEKTTRIREPGLVRTVIFLGDDGKQIPVLTNLQPAVKGAKVVHCLRLRWTQENSLKYLVEHYAIDQLIEYGAAPEQAPRTVANPRRKELNRKIRELSKQIQALEAELGRHLENGTTGEPETIADLRRSLEELRRSKTRLEKRRRTTPAKLTTAEMGPQAQRFLLKEDCRLLVNTLKLAAHNAERLLAMQFDRHYQQRKDVLSVFRSLFHLPGTLTRRTAQQIEVSLQRPSPEKAARALAALLEEVNQESPQLLGNGPVLHFRLEN